MLQKHEWIDKKEDIMNKKLVAYFSASGVTKKLAKVLAKEVGADLYEIKPEVPYTSADLNWNNKNARSTVEMHNKTFRPSVADRNAQVEQYDVIYVGFPIWWYVAPTIINTFLEQHNFSGKKIILFATSGGSGFGKTVQELKCSVDITAQIIEGAVFRGHWNETDLQALAEK